MAKQHAYRDLKLCTKDCLCLFVCPTGATNTETGQIDFEKCIGCGACANACPSHAITLVPNKMPSQQKKKDTVVKELFVIANQKIKEIKVLKYLLKNTTQESEKRLYKALIHSNKVVIEDLMRESGYMLPQSKISNDFLQSLTKGEMKEVANQLLEKIEIND